MDGSDFNYRREQEIKPYLKCTYGEGMHPRESFIRFKIIRNGEIREDPLLVAGNDGAPVIDAGALENHMWVNKRDVLTKEDVSSLRENQGFMRLEDIEIVGERAYSVLINDVGDMRLSRRIVPMSEVAWLSI